MSDLTFAQVLEADVSGFDTAATAWLALAQDLDDAAEEYIRTSGDLPNAWPSGSAATAASTENTTLRSKLSNAYPLARGTGEALRTLAAAMRDLRGTAWKLLEWAQREGYTIDTATGAVTAQAGRHDGTPAQQLRARVESIAGEVRQLVGRAREADDRARALVVANQPDAGRGFSATQSRPVTRDEIAGQRGRAAQDVKAWWEGLTPEQQEQAIRDFPDLVGWLDGVPATDRDTANRIVLTGDIHELENDQRRLNDRQAHIATLLRQGRGAELYPDEVNPVAAARRELEQIARERKQVDGELSELRKVSDQLGKLGGKGMLLGIDPAGDGKAIIAVGNPDTARHTAVWVPGLGTDLGDTASNVERVKNLQEAADGMTREKNDVATVMWLGYDAPELDKSVIEWERSAAGGKALDSFVDGLRATHQGGDHHLTAVGHSYGSTVVGDAARTGNGLAVDDLVTAGSPGMHTAHASDLVGITARHVWAGSAADDPVSDGSGSKYADYVRAAGIVLGHPQASDSLILGYEAAHGQSPHRPSFGANQFIVDTHGHSDYWRVGSQSLDNQARVVVEHYDQVGLVHEAAPTTPTAKPVAPPPPASTTPTPAPPPAGGPDRPQQPSPAPGPRP